MTHKRILLCVRLPPLIGRVPRNLRSESGRLSTSGGSGVSIIHSGRHVTSLSASRTSPIHCDGSLHEGRHAKGTPSCRTAIHGWSLSDRSGNSPNKQSVHYRSLETFHPLH